MEGVGPASAFDSGAMQDYTGTEWIGPARIRIFTAISTRTSGMGGMISAMVRGNRVVTSWTASIGA